MTKSVIGKKVVELIAQHIGEHSSSVFETALFEMDLRMTEDDIETLALAIEAEFDIDIQKEWFTTVEDLIQKIYDQVNSENEE